MIHDWTHTPPPRLLTGLRLQLWMRSGGVRRAVYRCDRAMVGLAFTDCTHPLQNIAVDVRDVLAWKLEQPISGGNL